MSSKSFGKAHAKVPHLIVSGGGLPGEIADVRADVEKAFRSIEDVGGSGTNPICCYEITTPAAAAPAGLEAATATSTSARTVTSFLAAGVAALAAYPRNLTFTTAGTTPASAPATATITGTLADGTTGTEVVNLAQTATIVSAVKCFKKVTSVAYSTGDGTDATVSIGFGTIFGLPSKVKVRAGVASIISEIAAGARVTTGTFALPSVSPNGSYSPATVPNGTNSYAVMFERDMS